MQLDDALAARSAAVPVAGTAAAAGPGGHRETAWGAALPEDAKAVIYCPAPSVMSSGRRNAALWVLEFAPRARRFIEPMMGWTGSTDTLTQVRLQLPTREAAFGYSGRQGLRDDVREPTHVRHSELARVRSRRPAIGHQVPLEVAWAWEAPHLALDQLGAVSQARGKVA